MNVKSKVIDATANMVQLSISGRVKSGETQPLESEMKKLLHAGCQKLILDVQEVASIDSSGIGEIIKMRADLAEQGGRIVLLGSNSRVEMMIKLSGLINFFPVAATEE